MNKTELSSAFLIGHKEVDADHEELINILNALIEVCEINDNDNDECYEKWQQFCDRLCQHFIDEEKIMRQFNFIDEEHEIEHQTILKNFSTMGEKYKAQNNWEECIFEIRHSVLAQILRHDLKFAEHLVSIGYNEI